MSRSDFSGANMPEWKFFQILLKTKGVFKSLVFLYNQIGTSLDEEIPSFSVIVTFQTDLKGSRAAPTNQTLDIKLNGSLMNLTVSYAMKRFLSTLHLYIKNPQSPSVHHYSMSNTSLKSRLNFLW